MFKKPRTINVIAMVVIIIALLIINWRIKLESKNFDAIMKEMEMYNNNTILLEPIIVNSNKPSVEK